MSLRIASFVLLLAMLPLRAAAQPSALPAAGPGLVFRAPVSGQALISGDVVEVSWDGVAPEAREVELLLSLDGGRHFLRCG